VFILFGFRTKLNARGAAVAATCPNCHNAVVLQHVHVRRWFTLFFIPVIPLGVSKRLLVCPVCRWSRDLPKTAEAATLDMAEITKQWQAGSMSNDDYTKRVDAYWALTAPDPAAGGTASDVEAS
jgi:hypothetical protein